MSLTAVSSGDRVHIGFFGLRNAGKSSLVNRITSQKISIVSDVKATTTDPVLKSMELLPLGPVVIMDTPGLDDEGELGEMRVKRALSMLSKTDIAVVVTDASDEMTEAEHALIRNIKKRNLPFIIAYNKADLLPARPFLPDEGQYVSCKTGEGIPALKKKNRILCRKGRVYPRSPVRQNPKGRFHCYGYAY